MPAMPRFPLRFLLVAAVSLLAVALAVRPVPATAPSPVSQEWIQKWAEDLDILEAELPASHPNPFSAQEEGGFTAALEALKERLPQLAHHQILTELAVIVASLQDGHTRLTLPLPPGSGFEQGHTPTPEPNTPELTLHVLPVRFALLEDGLFIDRIEEGKDWAVGARVLRIGELPASDAMTAVAPTVRRDNESQIKDLLPMHLAIPEILHARGVTGEPARVVLELSPVAGGTRTLVVEPAVPAEVTWVSMESLSRIEPPIYRRHPELNYWFEYFGDDRVLYLRYREVRNQEDESLRDFATRLASNLADDKPRALIIDLRGNSGGNNFLNLPLLHTVICATGGNRPGRLFTVIDRGTFSAAMMFAIDLERQTNAIFVGEPSGGKPNHHGDSRKIQLPNTGLTVRVSSLYWQYSSPRDDRPWIAPEIAVAANSADFFAGRDPVMETILSLVNAPRVTADSLLEGDWQGVLSARAERIEFVLHLRREGENWSGLLDLPQQGVTGLPLREVSVDAGSVQFELAGEGDPYRFQGTVRGEWLIGEVNQRGSLSHFTSRKRELPE